MTTTLVMPALIGVDSVVDALRRTRIGNLQYEPCSFFTSEDIKRLLDACVLDDASPLSLSDADASLLHDSDTEEPEMETFEDAQSSFYSSVLEPRSAAVSAEQIGIHSGYSVSPARNELNSSPLFDSLVVKFTMRQEEQFAAAAEARSRQLNKEYQLLKDRLAASRSSPTIPHLSELSAAHTHLRQLDRETDLIQRQQLAQLQSKERLQAVHDRLSAVEAGVIPAPVLVEFTPGRLSKQAEQPTLIATSHPSGSAGRNGGRKRESSTLHEDTAVANVAEKANVDVTSAAKPMQGVGRPTIDIGAAKMPWLVRANDFVSRIHNIMDQARTKYGRSTKVDEVFAIICEKLAHELAKAEKGGMAEAKRAAVVAEALCTQVQNMVASQAALQTHSTSIVSTMPEETSSSADQTELGKTLIADRSAAIDTEPVSIAHPHVVTPEVQTLEPSSGPLPTYVEESRRIEYEALMKNLETLKQGVAAFMADSNLKKLRLTLTKAVNTPLNAISTFSDLHLKDKLAKLRTLLSGDLVEIDMRQISVRAHPKARDFTMDLLARQIVKQAEDVVSAHIESAFPLALVTVGLWAEYPELGSLILANLYLRCPYLVPYYIPKRDSQTDLDYLQVLGYRLNDDNTVEKQDKFLKRLTGFVRFFAALAVTPVPAVQPKPAGFRLVSAPVLAPAKPNPLGLGSLWRLLCGLLNLPPRPDTTATVLCEVLTVSGFALQKAYGTQFAKFVKALEVYVAGPLRTVSGDLGAATLSRLETQLAQKQLSIPPGYIGPEFGSNF